VVASLIMVCIPTAIAAPSGPDTVTRAPAPVVVTPGFIVAGVIAHADGSVDAGDGTGIQQGDGERDRAESRREPA
jgi:cobalamin synthase